MKGLDLSRFKKISEGKDRTTLQHPDGHEIVIAHAALNQKMRDELKRLSPKKPKMMAEGGWPDDPAPEAPMEVAQSDAPPSNGLEMPAGAFDADPDSPAPAPKEKEVPEQSQQGLTAKPEVSRAKGMKFEPAPAPAETQVASAPPATNPFPAVPASMPMPRPTVQQIAQADSQQYQQQANLYGDDIVKGHIKPQTYSSLFAKQDLPGKIGSLFGMMLSSMGSGLTGQPNQFMEIMNKQIENDLNAQKETAHNAQNFYQMNLQKELNQASISKTKADQMMIEASMTKIPAEKERLVAEAKSLYEQANKTKQSAALDAQVNAHNQALQSAYHSLAISPMAQTPEGQQALGMLYQQVQTSITNKSDAAAGMKAFANVTSGAGQQEVAAATPTVDYNKLTTLQRSKMMPEGDVSAANHEAGSLEDTNVEQQIYKNAFQHLNTISAGKFTPADRQAAIQMLNTAMAREASGRYNESEAKAQAEALFPQVGDLPKTRADKYKFAMDYFDAQRANTPVLKRYGLIRQPLGKSFASKENMKEGPKESSDIKKMPGFSEGATDKSKDGKPIIFKEGKWRYK